MTAPKRPRGRPPLGDAARSVPVLIRLTAAEHAACTAAADPQPVSAWLRDLGRRASGLDKPARRG